MEPAEVLPQVLGAHKLIWICGCGSAKKWVASAATMGYELSSYELSTIAKCFVT